MTHPHCPPLVAESRTHLCTLEVAVETIWEKSALCCAAQVHNVQDFANSATERDGIAITGRHDVLLPLQKALRQRKGLQ